MGQMFKKTFVKEESGVSGAITAMMIILIISSFVSLVYTVYVPMWTKEDEAEHSKVVLSQFLDLKANIDDQIINRDENQGISVTSRVTLGREGGPIFGMGGTSGGLSINPYLDAVTMINTDTPDELLAHGRGNITYESRYTNYVNQIYTFQYGAVIVGQVRSTTGGKISYDAVMKVEPHFKAEKDLLGNVTVTIVQVAFFGDQTSIAGTQDVVVETTLQGVDTNYITRDEYPTLDNLTLNITTNYPEVWEKYFNERLDKNVSGMSKRVGLNGDYMVTRTGRLITVKFWNVNALNVDIAIMAIDLK